MRYWLLSGIMLAFPAYFIAVGKQRTGWWSISCLWFPPAFLVLIALSALPQEPESPPNIDPDQITHPPRLPPSAARLVAHAIGAIAALSLMTAYFEFEAVVEQRTASGIQETIRTSGPESALADGMSHFRQGRYALARKHFDHVLRINPRNPDALYYRGLSHLRMREYQESTADLSTLLKQDESAVVLEARGSAYMMLGRHEDALSDFNRAIAISPEDPRSYRYRGDVYSDTNRPQQAAEDYARARSLSVGSAAPLHPPEGENLAPNTQ